TFDEPQCRIDFVGPVDGQVERRDRLGRADLDADVAGERRRFLAGRDGDDRQLARAQLTDGALGGVAAAEPHHHAVDDVRHRGRRRAISWMHGRGLYQASRACTSRSYIRPRQAMRFSSRLRPTSTGAMSGTKQTTPIWRNATGAPPNWR